MGIFPRTTTWSFDTHLKSLICRKPAMAVLKVFCLCITPRTGSVVLWGLGIIMAVLMIVPPCLILESHEYYFNEFIREQKTYGGVDIRDEDIPAIKKFNQVTLATFVAYLVMFTFASILMLAGVAGRKSFLLVPWLIICFMTLLFFLIMAISAMFAIASIKALAVIFPAGVPLAFGVYFWFAVYSTFVQLRSEETAKMVRSAIKPQGTNSGSAANNNSAVSNSLTEVNPCASGTASTATTTATASEMEDVDAIKSADDVMILPQHQQHTQQRPSESGFSSSASGSGAEFLPSSTTMPAMQTASSGGPATSSTTIPNSISSSSFAQVKHSFKTAIGASPPPPYEAVASDIDKEEEALRAGMVERCELTLQSRLEPPTLTKDTSIDSTGTEDLTSASGASACTTQPLVQALQPPEASPLLDSPNSSSGLSSFSASSLKESSSSSSSTHQEVVQVEPLPSVASEPNIMTRC